MVFIRGVRRIILYVYQINGSTSTKMRAKFFYQIDAAKKKVNTKIVPTLIYVHDDNMLPFQRISKRSMLIPQ